MKKFIFIICTVLALCMTCSAGEAYGSGGFSSVQLNHPSFEELTGLSREDIHHIVIRSGVDGNGYSTAYKGVIDSIYAVISQGDFYIDMPEEDGAHSGGWKYCIKFFDENNEGFDYWFYSGMYVRGIWYSFSDNEALLEATEKAYKLMANDCINWAQDYVVEAKDKGFLDGIEGINYRQPITRENFCEIIYNMMSKSHYMKMTANPIGFTDTDNPKILALSEAGVINGKGSGLYAPDDFLTREEAATILCRAANCMGVGLSETAYDGKVYEDQDEISEFAFASVHWMHECGVMIGEELGLFNPKGTYTAEQAIASVVRLNNLKMNT